MGAAPPAPAPGRAAIGATARIDAVVTQDLRRVPIFRHCLILVCEGVKDLADVSGAQARVAAGDCVLLAGGSQPDIGNRPDPASRRYGALAMEFGPQTTTAFQHLYPALAAPRAAAGTAPWQVRAGDGALAAAIRHAADALADPALSDRAACHRCVEVLALLAERGLHLPAEPCGGVAAQVQALVAARPHAPLAAADAARALGVSEPTLRRRLAAEGTCFRAIVAEVRLTQGLMLLQTSRASILDIALACGYESPSRFASRFRERFGMSPSELRGGAS